MPEQPRSFSNRLGLPDSVQDFDPAPYLSADSLAAWRDPGLHEVAAAIGQRYAMKAAAEVSQEPAADIEGAAADGKAGAKHAPTHGLGISSSKLFLVMSPWFHYVF